MKFIEAALKSNENNGEWIKETSSTSTQIVGLDAGVEYCFTVKASNDYAVWKCLSQALQVERSYTYFILENFALL